MTRPILACLACLLLNGSVIFANTDAIPDPPYPARLVNDFAGIFNSSQRGILEEELVAFDDSTSNQIAVVTVSSLEGMSAAEFATGIHRKWGVGGKKNNGIVLLIKPKTLFGQGEVFISVGYGLEGAIPDIYCKRIVEDIMIPHLKEKDYFGAVEEACRNLEGLASGEISEPRDNEIHISVWGWLAILAVMTLAGILYAKFSKDDSDDSDKTGGSGGGPVIFFPFGGFGGGFGRRGGGGFGGFGGFGGGLGGGGGAGGRW